MCFQSLFSSAKRDTRPSPMGMQMPPAMAPGIPQSQGKVRETHPRRVGFEPCRGRSRPHCVSVCAVQSSLYTWDLQIVLGQIWLAPLTLEMSKAEPGHVVEWLGWRSHRAGTCCQTISGTSRLRQKLPGHVVKVSRVQLGARQFHRSHVQFDDRPVHLGQSAIPIPVTGGHTIHGHAQVSRVDVHFV